MKRIRNATIAAECFNAPLGDTDDGEGGKEAGNRRTDLDKYLLPQTDSEAQQKQIVDSNDSERSGL